MFLAMETIFYKFIVAGEPKDKVMIEDVGDENVKFLRELICLMKNFSHYALSSEVFLVASQTIRSTKKILKEQEGNYICTCIQKVYA